MERIVDIHDYCETVNRLCIAMQGKSEIVSAGEVERALGYAKNLPLKTAGEAMLFCAAINLMNAYVKQKNNRMIFGYGFKSYLGRLIQALKNKPIENVDYCITRDNGNPLLIVLIGGLQFSFHGIPCRKSDIQAQRIPFDGVRKQPCAHTLLTLAEANPFLGAAVVSEKLSETKGIFPTIA